MKTQKKLGRPALKIDADQVRAFAATGATHQEIADRLKIGRATLTRRLATQEFAGVYEQGQAELKVSLRRKQIELALGGHPTMLIWLGKQLLGQRDRVEHTGAGPGGSISLNVSASEELARRVDRIVARRRAQGSSGGTD